MKYKFIHKNRSLSTVMKMCRMFEISSSGYYFWLKKQAMRSKDNNLNSKIQDIFQNNNGAPRIHDRLKDLEKLVEIE